MRFVLRILFVATYFLVALSRLAHAGDSHRPNVFLITIDTLRADHVGCYGYRRNTTRHIDWLATRGVVFDVAVAQSPWTLPSMASLLTSRYPPELGVVHKDSSLPAQARTAPWYFRRAGYRTAAFVSGAWLMARGRRGRGFDRDFETFEYVREGERAGGISARVLHWLDRVKEQPFFVWVHYFDVHSDYDPPLPPGATQDRFEGDRRLGTTDYLKTVVHGLVTPTKKELERIEALYDTEIAYTDSEIGRVLGMLHERGMIDDTVVVVAADHGEEFMDHGSMLHTLTLYEELVRVPLVISYPAVLPSGHRVPYQVENVDVLPTLLELAGIGGETAMRGSSLVPLADVRAGRTAPRAFSHTDLTSYLSPHLYMSIPLEQRFETLFSLRTPRHKIVYSRSRDEFRLFDLVDDPGEKSDIYDEGNAAHRHLRDDLCAWVGEMDLPQVTPATISISDEETGQLRALGYLD
jgi:arylsulfatase A-like enzyme